MTAHETLLQVQEDHNWREDPIRLTTTDGIHRELKMHWAAIQALAKLIDSTGDAEERGFSPSPPSSLPGSEPQRSEPFQLNPSDPQPRDRAIAS